MHHNPLKKIALLILTALFFTACEQNTPNVEQHNNPTNPSPKNVYVAEIHNAHHNEHATSYWDRELIQIKNLKVIFNGQTRLEADFVFDPSLGKARMTLKDGTIVIFKDGTAYANQLPNPALAARLRFDVLTWPWFAVSAFKMRDSNLNQHEPTPFLTANDKRPVMKQTFNNDAGDSPDDWYFLFTDPDTGRLAGQVYIVTYFNTPETDVAENNTTIMTYEDYHSIDGIYLSKQWRFYPYDKTQGASGAPKGTATVGEYHFIKDDPSLFKIDQSWLELKLPGN